ncbi:hypothetical protein A4X13_0g8361 [Tilletia indica]|uniref:Uncharacterized protein n=1 Tax=Tilletia indica TaxID=43049 RepID=A0A177TB68_9BASI|nr:hypothetical protein A4X13_0g8361 [Tilletia indica]
MSTSRNSNGASFGLVTSLASVRPKTSQEGRKRGQNEVLRDIATQDRSVRASLMLSLQTKAAHDLFSPEPLVDLFLAGLPEFLTFTSSLWAYQQMIISTVLAVDAKGSLHLARVPQLLVPAALEILGSLQLLAAGTPRSVIIEQARSALDLNYGFDEGDKGLEKSQNEDRPKDANLIAKWKRTPFGQVETYVLCRGLVLYAIYGPHTDGYLSRSRSTKLFSPYPSLPGASRWDGQDDRLFSEFMLRRMAMRRKKPGLRLSP